MKNPNLGQLFTKYSVYRQIRETIILEFFTKCFHSVQPADMGVILPLEIFYPPPRSMCCADRKHMEQLGCGKRQIHNFRCSKWHFYTHQTAKKSPAVKYKTIGGCHQPSHSGTAECQLKIKGLCQMTIFEQFGVLHRRKCFEICQFSIVQESLNSFEQVQHHFSQFFSILNRMSLKCSTFVLDVDMAASVLY